MSVFFQTSLCIRNVCKIPWQFCLCILQTSLCIRNVCKIPWQFCLCILQTRLCIRNVCKKIVWQVQNLLCLRDRNLGLGIWANFYKMSNRIRWILFVCAYGSGHLGQHLKILNNIRGILFVWASGSGHLGQFL